MWNVMGSGKERGLVIEGAFLSLSLVGHHHLSLDPSNDLCSGLLVSSLLPINPHLVASIPHLNLVNGSRQPSGEKAECFNKVQKALALALPTCKSHLLTAFVF